MPLIETDLSPAEVLRLRLGPDAMLNALTSPK
jgi:hypothetical protein